MNNAKITSIQTDSEHEAALARIERDLRCPAGTQENDELNVLLDLVELYEKKRYLIELPGPISAIEFRMDQAGLTQADLASYIGSRSKVSEVLSGKRELTISMAHALHKHLRILVDV